MASHPTRLFDLLAHRKNKFGNLPLLAHKQDGSWHNRSTQDVIGESLQLAAGLLSLGLSAHDGSAERADKIAIISANRPEWILLDFACQQAGIILCPIYPTTNTIELEFIFNDAQVKAVFAGNDDLYHKVTAVQPKVESLQNVYTFDAVPGAKHWRELLSSAPQHSAAVQQSAEAIKPAQLATIIYTSGTTGTPKGVMLSHENIMSNVMNSKESFPFSDSPGKKVLSFLPLNHIFERMVTYIYILAGNHIYYAEGLEHIGDNLKEVQPSGFTTVPRLLEKVFEKIMSAGHNLEGLKKNLFFWAVDLGLQYDNLKPKGLWYNAQLGIARKLIFSKWKQALGGNIEFIITGGAACQERLLRVFNAAGIPVYEGYGPTENSPVISVNRAVKGQTKFGTVGPPIEGQQVKLADDGEIMVKGPSVMQGYYKRPDLTDETIKNGWLLTGDIGVWEEVKGVKFLKITDRKKELFKTSGGKYVAPQPIENKLKESPFIEQVMVVGAEKKFVGALIVPGLPSLKEWMRENNIPFTTAAEALKIKEVRAHYQELVEAFNKYFNHVEQIKKFELLPDEWTIDTGELTPTLKIKRKVVMEKYREHLRSIYGED